MQPKGHPVGVAVRGRGVDVGGLGVDVGLSVAVGLGVRVSVGCGVLLGSGVSVGRLTAAASAANVLATAVPISFKPIVGEGPPWPQPTSNSGRNVETNSGLFKLPPSASHSLLPRPLCRTTVPRTRAGCWSRRSIPALASDKSSRPSQSICSP